MANGINYSYKEKIEILINYFKNKKGNYYGDIPEVEFTSDESLKLYKNKEKFKEIPKSFLYSLLSYEDKKKCILDLKEFEEIEKQRVFSFVQEKEIINQIIEYFLDIGEINEDNYGSFCDLLKIEEPQERYTILHRILDKIPSIDWNYTWTLRGLKREDMIMSLLTLILEKHQDKITDVSRVSAMINTLTESKNIINLSCALVSSDCFAKNKIYAKINFESLLMLLNKEQRRALLDYVMSHKVNEHLSKEIALTRFSTNEIIDYLKEKGINIIDVDELVKNISSKVWLDLYRFFDSLPNARDYINYNFLYEGRGSCDFEVYNKIVKKHILLNEGISIEEKIKNICGLYKGSKILYGIELLIEHFGYDIDIDLPQIVEEKDDMNKYPNVINYIEKKFNITNRENLNKFLEKFNSLAIPYLYSDNIINLINMDSEKFDKVMNLISEKNTNLDMDIVNTVTNALLQRKFRIEQEDYNIFSKFERLLMNKNEYTIEEVNALLSKIDDTIDIYSIINKESLDVDKLFEKDEIEIDLLHKLTDAYIAKKREIYVAKNLESALSELNIDKYYAKAYIKKQFFLLNDEEQICHDLRRYQLRPIINDEERAFLKDYDRLMAVVKFKKNPKDTRPTPEMIGELKMLESIMNKYYEAKFLKLDPDPVDAKYEYRVIGVTEQHLLSILADINYTQLESNLLNNDKMYEKLNELLHKYKLPGWGETFERLGINADMNIEASMVSNLINYFDKIIKMYGEMPKNKRTLTVLLDYANVYSGCSNKYVYLANKENYNLISANPGPNSSREMKNKRIAKIPGLVKNMYLRDSVTVPSGEVDLNLDEEQKIHVSIADIYDPIALTYGERTGACLRIAGAFNDLFEYCLENKNGFHIRFTNPETGEFISRVSGIRNGNTVFLNELRDSVSEEYTSKDLVKALKMVAKFLVESTKNDPHPIENVVVSNDFAMSSEQEQELKIFDTVKAFNGLNFNISSKGHILYTADEENHQRLLPYKFGDEYTSEYKPYNKKVSVASKNSAIEVINRVHIINELMKDKKIDEIDLIEVENVEMCIYGHGWVVYTDSKKKMHELVIDKFKDDKKLRKLIEESKEKYFGGAKRETSRKNN